MVFTMDFWGETGIVKIGAIKFLRIWKVHKTIKPSQEYPFGLETRFVMNLEIAALSNLSGQMGGGRGFRSGAGFGCCWLAQP